MRSPHKLRPRSDPTHYPIEDDVGEGSLHRFIAELLRPLVERWLALRGAPCFVGADQFIYYEQYRPTKCVCPDVYVLPNVPPGMVVGCWKTWEMQGVPSFALEIVSSDHQKDYARTPARYAELGVKELIVFDPDPGPKGIRFHVYRKLARRGFVCVSETNADRVRSSVLGCWLRIAGSGDSQRLRLATGLHGSDLFPTDAEAAEARADAERTERLRLEAELAALRAGLGKRRR